MLSKENQADVIMRDKEIRDKIMKLQNEIAMLEMLDSFDPIVASGVEVERKEKLKELEGDSDHE